MQKNNSQSGRSMVEMLGVISIIGLITVAGITSMGYVDSHFRSSATVIEIDNMARDIIDSFSWSTNYSQLNMDFLHNEGILKSAGTAVSSETGEEIQMIYENRWGGAIDVQQVNGADSFAIIYSGVPEIPCRQMVNASRENEFHYMRVSSPAEESGCTDSNTMTFVLKDYDVPEDTDTGGDADSE